MADAIEIHYEENYSGSDWVDSYLATPLLDAKYEKILSPTLRWRNLRSISAPCLIFTISQRDRAISPSS